MSTRPIAPSPVLGPPPFAAGPRRRSAASWVVDIVVGGTLWAALSVVGMCAVYFSFFFAMAADACYSDAQCPQQDLIGVGMVTVWVGTAVALLVAFVGTLVSLLRKRYFWYWPLIGVPIVIAATWIGMELANRGGGLS